MCDLEDLNNNELREKCLEYGVLNIPVTDSTRNLIIRRLRAAISGTTLTAATNPRKTTDVAMPSATDKVNASNKRIMDHEKPCCSTTAVAKKFPKITTSARGPEYSRVSHVLSRTSLVSTSFVPRKTSTPPSSSSAAPDVTDSAEEDLSYDALDISDYCQPSTYEGPTSSYNLYRRTPIHLKKYADSDSQYEVKDTEEKKDDERVLAAEYRPVGDDIQTPFLNQRKYLPNTQRSVGCNTSTDDVELITPLNESVENSSFDRFMMLLERRYNLNQIFFGIMVFISAVFLYVFLIETFL